MIIRCRNYGEKTSFKGKSISSAGVDDIFSYIITIIHIYSKAFSIRRKGQSRENPGTVIL